MAVNQMPHNLDAEAALLGCIIIDAEIQSDLLESLHEEDFYQDSHKEILAAMKAVYAARMPVDVVTLSDRLERDGKLERAGGIAYITELAQITPSAANYKHYLEIVRRDSVNRKLIRAAKEIVENSMQGADERSAISFAEKCVYDISKQSDRSSLVGMADGEAIQEVLHKFENIQADPNAFRGIETGFRHLDRITNGLQRSDLIVLAARPGRARGREHGKSALGQTRPARLEKPHGRERSVAEEPYLYRRFFAHVARGNPLQMPQIEDGGGRGRSHHDRLYPAHGR